MDDKIEQLLTLIDEAVDAPDVPFAVKARAILSQCDDRQRMNLLEFVSWFSEVE